MIPLGTVSKAMKSKVMLSIDCEMVLCEDGTEAVVKVCAVDHNLEVQNCLMLCPNLLFDNLSTYIHSFSQFPQAFQDSSYFQVKLDELVNPNKAVADYRTDTSGISAEDLEGVTCSLADIQVVLATFSLLVMLEFSFPKLIWHFAEIS